MERRQTAVIGVVAKAPSFPRGGSREMVAWAEPMEAQIEENRENLHQRGEVGEEDRRRSVEELGKMCQ